MFNPQLSHVVDIYILKLFLFLFYVLDYINMKMRFFFLSRQVALADLVIVNKVDLADRDHVEELKVEVR